MSLKLPTAAEVRRAFDAAAPRYDQHAALEQEVASRLMEKLAFQRLEPRRILDLGCGTGDSSARLKKQFRSAEVIGLDSSMRMIEGLRKRSGLLRPLRPVCADFTRLPFPERSFDLVFSNLAIQWCDDPARLFNEIRRVLAPGGMLVFSTLGIGTFDELAHCWLQTGDDAVVAGFVDILEHGDALMTAGFREPVMDAERIRLEYSSLEKMITELRSTGMIEFLRNGDVESRMGALADAYREFGDGNRYPVSFEIVYGTAFGPEDGQPRKTAEGDVVTFSVESLRRTRPGS